MHGDQRQRDLLGRLLASGLMFGALAWSACSSGGSNLTADASDDADATRTGGEAGAVPREGEAGGAIPGALGGPAAAGSGAVAGAAGSADAPGPAGAPAAAGPARPAPAGSGVPAIPPASANAPPPAAPHPIDCTREGLVALTRVYLDGMIARDPSAVPFAPTLKYTENALLTKPADGLFKTAGPPLAFHRNLIDTEKCGTFTQAVVHNDVPEQTQLRGPTIIGVRLALEHGQITEAESYVVINSAVFYSAMGLIDSAADDWEGILADSQRSSRAELAAIAEAYFEFHTNALQAVPFGMPCDRLDNGQKQPSCDSGLGPDAVNPLPVVDRRFPIVDLEAGIALGFGLSTVAIPQFALLKVIDGKIRFINSGIAFVSYGATSSGWD